MSSRLTALALLLLSACGQLPLLEGGAYTPQAKAWSHETSDIPPNPRIRFGELDNGMRYAWMANAEPQHRSYLRLHVAVGSTAEEDSEQGMAHFLEHMAFNGSENFEAGTLVKWFQEHGMAFGAHVNASTSFTETIYKIDLPDTDDTSLREGLVVLSDFAAGLLLEPKEVAKEIGVVDGEERERDSAQFRVAIESLERQYAGTRIADRIPIGVREVRADFDDESVRAFYERWYRPENMTLIVVGDLGDIDPSGLITEIFGAIDAPERAPALVPDLGTPTFDDRFFALYNEEVPVVQLSVSKLREWEEEPVTARNWRDEVPLELAYSMLNTRLDEMTRQEDNPFLFAFVGSAEAFDVVDGESLSLATEPDRWEEGLAAAEQELRRALRFGFQQAELDEAVADAKLGLNESVERESTRSSQGFTNEILSAAGGRYVPSDATTDRDILMPAFDEATVEACQQALVDAWNVGLLSITCTGALDLGEDGGRLLREAFDKSRATNVSPPEEIETNAFAYASTARRAGEIAERRHVEDLDVHQVRFANGVLLNVKSTDFKERDIRITARIGEGQLALDHGGHAAAFLSGLPGVLSGIGWGEHSVDDMRRLTAGRQVGANLSSGEDSFAVSGSTNAEDFVMQLELMAAYVADPGWRDDVMKQMLQQIPLFYQMFDHQPMGPVMREFMPTFHGGDPRFGFPLLEDVQAVTIDDLREWVGPQLADGPIEVTVVGDVDVDDAVTGVARTFGTLPARRAARPYDERRQVSLTAGVRQEHTIETEVPDASLQVFYPTTDGFDALTRRRLSMLGTVLDDRIREQVREELGEAYSPGAASQAGRVYPGVGFIAINSSAEPERAAEVLEVCLDVADTLGAEGVGAEELDRLREPVLKRVRDQMRQNGFWLGMLSQSQSDPGRLDEVRELLSDYEGMTVEDISGLAGEYLQRDRASWVIVRPEEPEPGT